VLVLGVLAAAVFDSASEGCAQCPRNLPLVDGDNGTYESLNRVGLYLGLACSLLLILLAVAGLIWSAPAGRRLAVPVVVAGCVYLGLVAADCAHSLAPGFLGDDPLDRWLWLGQAAAFCALSAGVAWAWVRARRAARCTWRTPMARRCHAVPAGRPPLLRHHRSRRTRTRRRPELRVRPGTGRTGQRADVLRHDHQPGRPARAVERRLAEIHERYGPGHLVSRSIRRATPMILRAVEQVQDRTARTA
jgi:hypothetical protein